MRRVLFGVSLWTRALMAAEGLPSGVRSARARPSLNLRWSASASLLELLGVPGVFGAEASAFRVCAGCEAYGMDQLLNRVARPKEQSA